MVLFILFMHISTYILAAEVDEVGDDDVSEPHVRDPLSGTTTQYTGWNEGTHLK